jgi:hypothetical protein
MAVELERRGTLVGVGARAANIEAEAGEHCRAQVMLRVMLVGPD